MDRIFLIRQGDRIMDKVCLARLLEQVASEANVDIEIVKKVYTVFVRVVIEELRRHKRVGLTGFGVFDAQKHKGHPVQFGATKQTIDDYVVLKFSASDAVKRMLNENIK